MQTNSNIAAKRPSVDSFWPSPVSQLTRSRSKSFSEAVEPTRKQQDLFANAIVEETLDCIEVVDGFGRLLFINATGIAMLGCTYAASIVGTQWINNWIFENELDEGAALAAVQSGECAQFEAYRRAQDGTVESWSVRVSGISGMRSLVVSRDVTSDRQALNQQLLVNAELQHRIKNILAVVQSLVSQTLRDGVEVGDARQTLADRLTALACAGDMLMRTDWQSLPLATVVADAISFMKLGTGRIVVGGPKVTIGPKSAFMLMMVFHELSTNALKYGALSVEGGHVELRWWLVTNDRDARIHIGWCECGGPPVSTPLKTGFGSRLVGQVAERQLRAKVSIMFDPGGLVWSLDAPLLTLMG